MRRDRSQAIVVRGDRILLVEHHMFGRVFFALPGGGIEAEETPEEAALRELSEECNVSGRVIRPTSTQYKPNHQGVVYTYLVEIKEDAVPTAGCDPELPADQQSIQGVKWCTVDELSQRDQIALWSSGLMRVEFFYQRIQKMN